MTPTPVQKEDIKMGILMSPTIGKISEALAKAQGTIKGAIKDAENPYFKSNYSDLESVINAIAGPLSENNIARVQADGITGDGKRCIYTMLSHSSGEWIQSCTLLDVGNTTDAQKIKSAHTLLRRGALVAIVGVPELDDDGNGAQEKPKTKTLPNHAPQHTAKPQNDYNVVDTMTKNNEQANAAKANKLVTDAQIKRMWALQKNSKLSENDIGGMMELRFKKSSSKDLTMAEYDALCSVIMANTEVKQ